MIKKKQSLFKTIVEGIPSEFWFPFGILINGGLTVYALFTKNLMVANILFGYFISPIALFVFASIVFNILCQIDYLKAANRIKYLPLTKEEFDSLTNNMTLTECLNWLDKTISYGGPNDDEWVFPNFKKTRYAGYILQYYIFTYEKYKDIPLSETESNTPNILYYTSSMIGEVDCSDVGIKSDLKFLDGQFSDLRTITEALKTICQGEKYEED